MAAGTTTSQTAAPVAELFSMSPPEARSSGKALKAALRNCIVDRDKALMTDLEQRVAALSAQPGTSAGFTITPMFPADRLSDDEWRLATLTFLGATLPTAPVAIGEEADILGRAALDEKTGSARNDTHNAIRDVLADIAHLAGRSVSVEQRGLFGPYPGQRDDDDDGASMRKRGENRRIDVCTLKPASGERDMIDATRVNGATAARLRAPDVLKALRDAEVKKRAKYQHGGPPGRRFITFAIGTQGELGVEAEGLLRALALERARLLSFDDTPSASLVQNTYWHSRRRIGVTLLRMQARQCMQATVADTDRSAARAAAADFLRSLRRAPPPPTGPRAANAAPIPHHATRGRRSGSARSSRGTRHR